MSVSIQMPKWKCHKEVWALKIRGIGLEVDGQHQIIHEDGRFAPINVSDDFINKHVPQPGGYFVVYADGYQSYSPEKAFEEGYTLIPTEEK